DDFNPSDLQGTKLNTINLLLDGIDSNGSDSGTKSDGWTSSDIKIMLPTGKRTQSTRSDGPLHAPGSAEEFGEPFMIPGFRHRSLIQAMKNRFSDPHRSQHFHYRPFTQVLTRPDGTEERVIDNLYTSDAWIEEHERIQTLEIQTDGPEPCKLERAVAAFMLGSDTTTASEFGQNSLWPVYGYFGNEPKWYRRKPGQRASEHLAYIPKLPDSVKDRIASLHGKAARAPLLAHCKREIFQECWSQMLDSDFVHAYHNGMIVKCGDGVIQRLFPRLFTYSADYPE
ncbi:hypothetical protein FRC10_005574, partial [Ceratobasidium sp. 414]